MFLISLKNSNDCIIYKQNFIFEALVYSTENSISALTRVLLPLIIADKVSKLLEFIRVLIDPEAIKENLH